MLLAVIGGSIGSKLMRAYVYMIGCSVGRLQDATCFDASVFYRKYEYAYLVVVRVYWEKQLLKL